MVVVAVDNHSLVQAGAVPDEGARLCDSHIHALHGGEGSNREGEGDIPPPSPILLKADASHDSRGGPCNQYPYNLFGCPYP